MRLEERGRGIEMGRERTSWWKVVVVRVVDVGVWEMVVVVVVEDGM